jgi:hypothetical protein
VYVIRRWGRRLHQRADTAYEEHGQQQRGSNYVRVSRQNRHTSSPEQELRRHALRHAAVTGVEKNFSWVVEAASFRLW